MFSTTNLRQNVVNSERTVLSNFGRLSFRKEQLYTKNVTALLFYITLPLKNVKAEKGLTITHFRSHFSGNIKLFIVSSFILRTTLIQTPGLNIKQRYILQLGTTTLSRVAVCQN